MNSCRFGMLFGIPRRLGKPDHQLPRQFECFLPVAFHFRTEPVLFDGNTNSL